MVLIMNRLLVFIIMTLLGIENLFSQNYFRSGIFLHHSTGGNIWGPNPDGNSTTTIPDQMNTYNQIHGYTGNQAIAMSQEWWSPGDNEWSTQHEFFEGNAAFTDLNYYLTNYKILVVKSCFPSSAIDSWGAPSDTADPTYKSVCNYKWHWRHILNVMKNHPQNFFAIWTNVPLEIHSTNSSEALLSKKFCKWAKDTLAAGLDPVFGSFPPNVYVFDYFGKMSDENGYELQQFVTGDGDSHPNGAGTDFIAPQFVNEIFDASIHYEAQYNGLIQHESPIRVTCFPNPVQALVHFTIRPDQSGKISIKIYSCIGTEIYNTSETVIGGDKIILGFDLSRYSKGVYFFKVSSGHSIYSGKIIRQ